VITADVNWLEPKPTTVSGELIDFDAGPADVALVAIRTGVDFPAVSIGPRNIVLGRGDQVFSIGCDKGSPPTIRRTRIKNNAKYDGAEKYEIFGRPVDGRSGGGLFTSGGQIIGVCNAAAVNEDEGIFSSIGNLHDELIKSDLAHLFEAPTSPPSIGVGPATQAVAAAQPAFPNVPYEMVPLKSGLPIQEPVGMRNVENFQSQPTFATDEYEAIVVLRSRSNPAQTTTVVIDRPTSAFLSLLAESQNQDRTTERELAELREAMPQLPVLRQSGATLRAQSPK
jgi:hypothetical protein